MATGEERGIPRSERRVGLLGPLVSVALALWMVRGVAGGSPPAGDDVMAHLARLEVGLDVLGSGQLDGWFPRFMLGIDEFLFYGQGFTVVVALVKVVSLGLLSTVGAYKVVTIASFAATGPAVAFFVRGLGLERRVAAVAAVLVLLVSCPFGGGIHGLYVIGMAPHQVGTVLFFVVLGLAARTIDEHRWWRWTAVAAAALVVTHVITAMVLALVLPMVLLSTLVSRGRDVAAALRGMVLAGVGAVGVAAFWLVPAFVFRGQQGVVTTWGTPPIGSRVSEIARTGIVYPAALEVGPVSLSVAHVAAVAIPACILILRGRRTMAAALAATPLVYLAVAHTLASRFDGNSITLQLANRGLGYAAMLALIPVAVVVSAAVALPSAWRNRSARGGPERASRSAGRGRVEDLVGVLLAAAAVVALTGSAQAVAGQQPEAAPELEAVARTLARVVPDGARFATERAYPEEIALAGVTHPDYWLVQRSGRNSLNIFNPESTPAGRLAFITERIATTGPHALADELARLGTSHVVAIRPSTVASLTSSGRFERLERSGGDGAFTVLEVRGRSGEPSPAAGASFPLVGGQVDLVRATREHLVLDVEPQNAGRLEVAVSWSPRWTATVDGRSVRIQRTSDALIAVPVTSRARRVELRHQPTGWDHLGAAISLTTAVALAVPGTRARWRRHRTRDGIGDPR